MSHKKHTNEWMWLIVVICAVVLLVWKRGYKAPTLVPGENDRAGDTNQTGADEEFVGERIVPEPQPPQVPIARVSEVETQPELPKDVL